MAGRADQHSAAPERRPVNRLGVRGVRRAAHPSQRNGGHMRAGLVRPNLRVLKSTDVVQVLTAAEQRPASDRQYPFWPHGLLLAMGFSALCWLVLFAALYLWWWR